MRTETATAGTARHPESVDARRARTLAARWRWRWRPRLRRAAFEGMRGLFALAARAAPDFVWLAVREARPVVRPLDWPGGRLRIRADSWIEYEKRARSCAKEPETVAWIERHLRPGDVVYDIGANVGAYSLVMGRVLQGRGRVYAFEPGFPNFVQLCRNIALNGLADTVVPLQVALSDRTGLGELAYSSLDSGAALHTLEGGGERFRMPLLSYALDELVERFGLEPPAHIKLDVDGIEHAVLLGARRVLAHPRLRTLSVETEDGRPGAERIDTLLRAHGFVLAGERVHDDDPFHPGPYVRNRVYVREGAPPPQEA